MMLDKKRKLATLIVAGMSPSGNPASPTDDAKEQPPALMASASEIMNALNSGDAGLLVKSLKNFIALNKALENQEEKDELAPL